MTTNTTESTPSRERRRASSGRRLVKRSVYLEPDLLASIESDAGMRKITVSAYLSHLIEMGVVSSAADVVSLAPLNLAELENRIMTRLRSIMFNSLYSTHLAAACLPADERDAAVAAAKGAAKAFYDEYVECWVPPTKENT